MEEKKSGKEREVACKRERASYVYALECEKEEEITSLFSLRSQMCLCVYLALLALTLGFEDNYFSYNTVPGRKLINTFGAQPKKQQSVFRYTMVASNVGLF